MRELLQVIDDIQDLHESLKGMVIDKDNPRYEFTGFESEMDSMLQDELNDLVTSLLKGEDKSLQEFNKVIAEEKVLDVTLGALLRKLTPNMIAIVERNLAQSDMAVESFRSKYLQRMEVILGKYF